MPKTKCDQAAKENGGQRGRKHKAVLKSAEVAGVEKVKQHAPYNNQDVGDGNNTGELGVRWRHSG